jgi:hypothetical protein
MSVKYKDGNSNNFYSELARRLQENKRLYREDSPFSKLDTPVMRFVASYLGVNPWKVLVPTAITVVMILRLIFGSKFSEIVLRVLGGP